VAKAANSGAPPAPMKAASFATRAVRVFDVPPRRAG
jgi:hypothetical protein